MEENKIIRDLRVLAEDFLPSRIVHRDGELKALRDCVLPVTRDQKPRHSFLHGPPGTGKTCLSQYVVEELRKVSPVQIFYVNCWEDSTSFKILYTILKEMGAFIHRKGTPTDELVETFRNKVEGKECIVVLDEVDQLEEDKILYDLLQEGVGLVMISNSETALYQADPRIRSRLASADTIPFRPYSIRDLADILKDRMEWGLVPGTIRNSQLERIAEIARGDARIALGVLSLAARKAEDQDMEKIPDSLLEGALPLFQKDSRKRALEKLNPSQKMVVEVLREKGKIKSGDLYSLVNKKSEEEMVERTFRKQMEKLVRTGLVSSEGEGRWREYSLKQ